MAKEQYALHRFARMLNEAQRFEEDWRKRNQLNFEYYDGDQWTEDERCEIEERGQQPTVINTIAPTVDMVCSIEADKRCDIQVCGREESDDSKASLLTALLKHVFDQSDFEYYHSQCFREALIGGRSWIECGIFTDERGKDMVKLEQIPWEDVYIDPSSRKPDASDARYIIKVKWVDRDVVKKLFPGKESEIDSHFDDDYHGHEYEVQKDQRDWYREFYFDDKNQRVKICECYYTIPEKRKVKVFDDKTGKNRDAEVFVQAVRFVIFSDDVILQGSLTDDSVNKNPLGIDIYPLVPVYCTVDHKGHPRGIVSGLIDIQDQINKLNSKFLWTIASNRVILESGAARDNEEFRDEMQKPDGLCVLNEGGLGKMRLDDKSRDLSYMSNHLDFLLRTEQRISGVNDSMLGLGGTNERSGIMQSTRISQGAAMQTAILENFYFSKQRIAYVVLRLIGKFYTDYRVVRITQPNGLTDNFEFNAVETDANGEPTGRIFNKIEDTLYYDIHLNKVPPFTSMRERQLQIFSEVLKTNAFPPEITGKILLSLSDIPNKQDLILQLENIQQAQAQQQQAMAQMAMEQQQGGAQSPAMM